MAGIGSTVDLLLFYTLERVFFNRMVGPMGKASPLVKKAMALWLMLEEIGYHDLIRKMSSFDNKTIEALLKEALRCVECIQLETNQQPEEFEDSFVFIDLFDEPMNMRFFYYNREFLYKRFAHIMETVCHKIFGENAAMEVVEFSSTRPVLVRPSGEPGATGVSTSSNSVRETSAQLNQQLRQLSLNPNATEFNPEQTTLEDSRTMFLTFSVGHPLTRDEIIHFFTSNWGQVVEEVVIEQTRGAQQPLYGRLILSTSMVIPRILNGQATAKFIVNRKHLRVRRYVPHSTRPRRH